MSESTTKNWKKIRRESISRLSRWVNESEDLIFHIETLIENMYEYQDAESFLSYLDSYTKKLQSHQCNEIRNIFMAFMFGADVEVKEE